MAIKEKVCLDFFMVDKRKELKSRLESLLSSIAFSCGFGSEQELKKSVARLVISIAGVASKSDQDNVHGTFKSCGWKDETQVTVVDDTWAGLVGGLLSDKGVCVFASTGASIFVGTEFLLGRTNKFDGWGPLIGDHGSGFAVAIEMLKHICRDLDLHNRIKSALTKAFFEYVGEEAVNPQKWLSATLKKNNGQTWKQEIGFAAKIVTELAESGDADAIGILHNQSELLCQTTVSAVNRRQFIDAEIEGMTIVCQGGMFRHSDLFFTSFCQKISRDVSNRVRKAQFRPVFGAALMARGIGSSGTIHNSSVPQSSELSAITDSLLGNKNASQIVLF